MSTSPDITQLLDLATEGRTDACDQLFSLVYAELRQLADRQMRAESAGHTLQPTALVHEVWLKLLGKQSTRSWNNRSHFFASAAQAMRRILVDSARSRLRQKRGGAAKPLTLQDHDVSIEPDAELLSLDEALEQLKQVDATKAALVELRFFGGLTNAQACHQLDISPATGERYWTFARAWLRNRMDDQQSPDDRTNS